MESQLVKTKSKTKLKIPKDATDANTNMIEKLETTEEKHVNMNGHTGQKHYAPWPTLLSFYYVIDNARLSSFALVSS